MNLQAGQAIGRSSRPRRVGRQLVVAGQSQPGHHALIRRRQFDRSQLEIRIFQRAGQPIVKRLLHPFDGLGRAVVHLILDATGDFVLGFGLGPRALLLVLLNRLLTSKLADHRHPIVLRADANQPTLVARGHGARPQLHCHPCRQGSASRPRTRSSPTCEARPSRRRRACPKTPCRSIAGPRFHRAASGARLTRVVGNGLRHAVDRRPDDSIVDRTEFWLWLRHVAAQQRSGYRHANVRIAIVLLDLIGQCLLVRVRRLRENPLPFDNGSRDPWCPCALIRFQLIAQRRELDRLGALSRLDARRRTPWHASSKSIAVC